MIFSSLQVIQESRKGRDADSCSDDDGLFKVIEALSRSAKGTRDTNRAEVLELSQLASPVAIGLDMQLHLPADTS